MSASAWKRAFFVLAGVVVVFAGGLIVGLSRPNSPNEDPQPVQIRSGGDTRITSPAEPSEPEAEEGTFAAVAEQVLPVVVDVDVVEVVEPETEGFSPFDFFFGPDEREDFAPEEFERPGIGSGVIVRQQGDTVYVLTNNHVVGDADDITLSLHDGRQFSAEVVGGDERLDLALLSFETKEDMPVASLGNSNEITVGDWVMAVGNPFGFESTVTAGIISATGRRAEGLGAAQLPELTDFIQTDAAINPGNSGGALVNMDGEIIGINTWIAGSQAGGNVGLGFAIPINNAADAIDQFIEEGRIVYGWLGVSISDTDSEQLMPLFQDLGVANEPGSLVLNVHRDSPGGRDGLRPGDLVVEVAGETIESTFELQREIGNIPPGQTRPITVVRQGEEHTFDVTLDERAPEDEVRARTDIWPGFTAMPLEDAIRDAQQIPGGVDGAVVVDVTPDSPAAQGGLRPSDVIVSVDGEPVESARDLYALLAEDTGTRELRVNRGGQEVSATLPGF